MKNVDYLIHRKIREILFCLLFLLVTSFVWYSHANSETTKLMKQVVIPNSYAYVDVLKQNTYTMFPMDDDVALNRLIPTRVNMVNDSLSKTKYSFGLKVSKDSTLDYTCLKISLNSQISYLKDFYLTEDDDFYYFLLESGSLKGETREYQFKMWLDAEVQNEAQNQTFLYEFVNLENI